MGGRRHAPTAVLLAWMALASLLGEPDSLRGQTGASPFAGLRFSDWVSTSHDEYGVWVTVTPSKYWLRFPNRPPLESTPATKPMDVWLMVSCRADGRAGGYDGPSPVEAFLEMPMHPADPDVPTVVNPRFWLRALTGREEHRTPVRVEVAGSPPTPGALIQKRIYYSHPRPEQQLTLDALDAMKALAAGEGFAVLASGEGVDLRIWFAEVPEDARRAARLIREHCPAPAPGLRDRPLG